MKLEGVQFQLCFYAPVSLCVPLMLCEHQFKQTQLSFTCTKSRHRQKQQMSGADWVYGPQEMYVNVMLCPLKWWKHACLCENTHTFTAWRQRASCYFCTNKLWAFMIATNAGLLYNHEDVSTSLWIMLFYFKSVISVPLPQNVTSFSDRGPRALIPTVSKFFRGWLNPSSAWSLL